MATLHFKTMNKLFVLPVLIIVLFLVLGNSTEFKIVNENEYQKNLNVATELYLQKKIIPESVLVKLVPKNYEEFNVYYATTEPDHKLGATDFFYDTTQQIFEQVTSKKNDDFYLPSLKLISFADGEFAEEFIENLKLIIKLDQDKFCKAISGKEYAQKNPIKYYSELNNCE